MESTGLTMNKVISFYDLICKHLWPLCRLFFIFLINTITLLGRCLQKLWIFLGKVNFSRKLWQPIDRFFKLCHSIFCSKLACLFYAGITRLVLRFDKTVSASKIAKRFVPLALFVVIFLFLYPPSHWGPWYFYQEGTASYYGPKFYGRKTADGTLFLPGSMTAAHKTLPLGTRVKVTNIQTGKSIYVLINDRGPYVNNRIIDLSETAAKKIGLFKQGIGPVKIFTRHPKQFYRK